MSAKFFFYPEPNNGTPHLVTLDLGEDLGEMYSDIIIDAVDGVSLVGGIQRSVGRTQEIVTIQRDRMLGGEDLAYQFEALQNHLDRGYSVAFTSDHTKMFCFPLLGNHQAATQKLSLGYPSFAAITGSSSTPDVGDYMTIDTMSPAMIREKVKISANSSMSGSGGSVDIDKPLNFAYTRRAFLRSQRFYPILKRPQSDVGQSIITNEGGRLFSLSVRLIVDYEALFAFHPQSIGSIDIGLGQSLVPEFTGSGVMPNLSGLTLDGGVVASRSTAGIQEPIINIDHVDKYWD